MVGGTKVVVVDGSVGGKVEASVAASVETSVDGSVTISGVVVSSVGASVAFVTLRNLRCLRLWRRFLGAFVEVVNGVSSTALVDATSICSFGSISMYSTVGFTETMVG